MLHKKNKQNKGFTLIEMLVSIAIFSIILVMILGIIVTIVDTSRKARTLAEVMNNLNFSFESLTRTLKTARSIEVIGTSQIVATDQRGDEITYTFDDNKIYRSEDGSLGIPITSDEVSIETYYVEQINSEGEGGLGNQPRVFFSIKGRVETTHGISSEFNLQSTVSQRELNLD